MSHFSLREVIVLPNIITSQLLHDGSPLIFGKKGLCTHFIQPCQFVLKLAGYLSTLKHISSPYF